MLTEDKVNEWVRQYLEENGFTILDFHPKTSQGPDVLAEKNGKMIEFECKGSCSPKTGKKFNKPQDSWQRVTQAFWFAVTKTVTHPDRKYALAFPDDGYYFDYLTGLYDFLSKHNIEVYKVHDDSTVEVWKG